MDINMDVATNRFTGKQTLAYTNNSPGHPAQGILSFVLECLSAGQHDGRPQPGSWVRSPMARDRSGHEQLDWDSRVTDRILHLKPDETGYQKVLSLTMNGVAQPLEDGGDDPGSETEQARSCRRLP